MPRLVLFVVLVTFAISPAYAITIGSAGVSINAETDGSYSINFVSLGWEFRGNAGAQLANLAVTTGLDSAGAYQEIGFDFVTDTPRHAAMRLYNGRAEVLFCMRATQAGPNSFAFPSFTQFPRGLNHLTYSGAFAPPSFRNLASESPWIFFDDSMRTFMLSPAANFMVASTYLTAKGELASGIAPEIVALPAGFEHRTLLTAEQGINRVFDTWGRTLTDLGGKRRPSNDADTSLNQVGYWTDNGASYYYQSVKGMNYQQTLSAVKADFNRVGVALGYVQLDSWFYPKGADALWSNNGRGIYKYVAASPLFGAGLGQFQQQLGVPLITHARWIDLASPYLKIYRMSGNVVLDKAYWDTVAGYLSTAGVATYEQDWLADKAQTEFNLNDGREFLDNMAAAMASRNLTLQYCMASPRHFLQSSRYSNLTTIRTSGDRFGRDRWSHFLYTSRLASALGIWPFTDNFNSTETANLLIATLSAGPVGLGDAVGSLSATNVLHAVRKDGVIVKPDAPLIPIDSSYLNLARGVDEPQIHAAWSDSGAVRTHYVFAYPQGGNVIARFTPADFGATERVYLYDYFAGTGQLAESGEVVEKAIAGDALYVIAAPVGPSGMALLGDLDQFVPMGRKRIAAYSDDGRMHVKVAFAAGETERNIQGYGETAPVAVVEEGSAGAVKWDAATHRFSIVVRPGASGTATLELRRLHQRSRF